MPLSNVFSIRWKSGAGWYITTVAEIPPQTRPRKRPLWMETSCGYECAIEAFTEVDNWDSRSCCPLSACNLEWLYHHPISHGGAGRYPGSAGTIRIVFSSPFLQDRRTAVFFGSESHSHTIRLMSLEFLLMTLMSLKTARIYRILSHPLQAFFIQRKRLLVFHQKLKNFCFRILGTEIIHWAKKGRNNKSRNFGSARPGLTASSVSTWKPRSSS